MHYPSSGVMTLRTSRLRNKVMECFRTCVDLSFVGAIYDHNKKQYCNK